MIRFPLVAIPLPGASFGLAEDRLDFLREWVRDRRAHELYFVTKRGEAITMTLGGRKFAFDNIGEESALWPSSPIPDPATGLPRRVVAVHWFLMSPPGDESPRWMAMPWQEATIHDLTERHAMGEFH